MLSQDLRQFLSDLPMYAELRVQENRTMLIALNNGNMVRNEQNSILGGGARVFRNGYWGFASHPELSEASIARLIKKSDDNADFLSGKGGQTQSPYVSEPVESIQDLSTKKERWAQERIMKFLESVDAYILEKYPDLLSRVVVLNCLEIEKNLITSGGACSYLKLPRSLLFVKMVTQKDGKPCEMMEGFGGRGHLEDHFSDVEGIAERIETLYQELRKKNEGIYPQAGIHEVILDADLAGILAHEAFGHTVEADLVRNGSIAGDYLHKQVASPLVTLVDFAHSYAGALAPIPVFIDDEGVTSRDAVIVEKGVLNSFLHNRDSAHQMGQENFGNARAWSYSDEPLIRMRNTAILPGSSKLEEMIASIEDGYYFQKTSNGQADFTGEFMFGVTAGYEIKGGKLGKALKDTTISGRAFDVLSSVSMISDQMKWDSWGMCGKKQPIPVGMGGPAIKCKINVGGK